MIHNKTEQGLEQDHNADLYLTWGGKQAKLGLGHITHVEEI